MKNQPRLRSSLAPTYITFYGGGVRSAPPRKVRTASTMNTKKAIFAAKKAMPLISPKPNKAAIKAITRNKIAKRNIEKSPSNFPFDAKFAFFGNDRKLVPVVIQAWSYRWRRPPCSAAEKGQKGKNDKHNGANLGGCQGRAFQAEKSQGACYKGDNQKQDSPT